MVRQWCVSRSASLFRPGLIALTHPTPVGAKNLSPLRFFAPAQTNTPRVATTAAPKAGKS